MGEAKRDLQKRLRLYWRSLLGYAGRPNLPIISKCGTFPIIGKILFGFFEMGLAETRFS